MQRSARDNVSLTQLQPGQRDGGSIFELQRQFGKMIQHLFNAEGQTAIVGRQVSQTILMDVLELFKTTVASLKCESGSVFARLDGQKKKKNER